MEKEFKELIERSMKSVKKLTTPLFVYKNGKWFPEEDLICGFVVYIDGLAKHFMSVDEAIEKGFDPSITPYGAFSIKGEKGLNVRALFEIEKGGKIITMISQFTADNAREIPVMKIDEIETHPWRHEPYGVAN